MVLLSHTRNDFFLPYNMLPDGQQGPLAFLFYFVCRLGHEAVIAFFVISGFLVGGRGLEKIMTNTFNNKSYIIDRAVRIGIPLVASIIFFFITSQFIGQRFEWLTAVGNLFSLQGVLCQSLVSPFWSLSYEVWFYILLLGISLVASKKRSGLLIVLICCLVFVKLDPQYLLMWFMGAFAYLCRPTKHNKWIQWGALLMIMATISLSIVASESHAISFSWKPNRDVIVMLLAASMCLFIQQIILCQPTGKVSVKVEKAFSYLAGFSYTLYLSHRITLLLVFKYIYDMNQAQFTLQGIIAYVSILCMCLVVSWGLYMISERHTYTVKKKIKSIVAIK